MQTQWSCVELALMLAGWWMEQVTQCQGLPTSPFPRGTMSVLWSSVLHFIATCRCPGPSVVSSEPSKIMPVSLWASFFVCMCGPASVPLHHKLILPRQKYPGSQITALQLHKWLGRGNHWNRAISILFLKEENSRIRANGINAWRGLAL